MRFIMRSTSRSATHTLANIVIEKDDIIDVSKPVVVEIPPVIGGVKVIHIGSDSDSSSICIETGIPASITKDLCINLVIPEGVEKINDYAFASDEYLLSVTIPSSLTTIGEKAFQYCKWLKRVIIPKDSKLEYISRRAFFNSNLQYLDFPSSIKYIGNQAFAGSRLQAAVFPEDVDGLTILSNAFTHSKLKSVCFPKNIKKIGNYAFACINPLKKVTFPKDCSLSSLSKGCFNFCGKLEAVTLGHNLRTINEGAFNYCTLLEDINLQDTKVRELGDKCFSSCFNLRKLTFPETLTSLGKECFSSSSVQEFDLSNIKFIGSACFSHGSVKEVILPAYEEYEFNLFSDCTELHSVEFTGLENVDRISISNNMFGATYALKEIDFPEQLVEIGSCAFFCSGISSIDLSKTKLSSIQSNAFAHTNIALLSLPKSVGYIAKEAFEHSKYPEHVVESAAVFMC